MPCDRNRFAVILRTCVVYLVGRIAGDKVKLFFASPIIQVAQNRLDSIYFRLFQRYFQLLVSLFLYLNSIYLLWLVKFVQKKRYYAASCARSAQISLCRPAEKSASRKASVPKRCSSDIHISMPSPKDSNVKSLYVIYFSIFSGLKCH